MKNMLKPIWELRSSTTHQFTTFDRISGEKARRIAPGDSVVIAETDSPGIITRFFLTFPGWFWQHWNPEHPVDPTLLRKLILRMYWDGSAFPSVQSPLGDFFGVGHCEYRQWASRFLGMSSGGFYSYFPMPFQAVRIEVENLHESMEAQIFANITWDRVARIGAEAGRFHCSYRQQENAGPDPVEILRASGRGHYVGCCVSLQGRDLNYLSFLEAPEYIFIDAQEGDDPVIVGTGMEDYFNGGWYFRDQEFCAPLHGVSLKDSLRSMVSMYRFHEYDAVAFTENIRFEFRNPWKPERLKPFRSSATAYWYQDKPTALFSDLPPRGELARLYRIRDIDHQSIP
jgi:hypothetical protein